jgi:hypothetical protein
MKEGTLFNQRQRAVKNNLVKLLPALSFLYHGHQQLY